MYPQVQSLDMVGQYDARAKAGGGYVWDAVLEYRVWCHPKTGDDFYYVFETAEAAIEYASEDPDAEAPLALILQKEYISEPETGQYIHVKEERIAEWPLEFLSRPRRDANTIPNFLSPDAPANRLDIIRGIA